MKIRRHIVCPLMLASSLAWLSGCATPADPTMMKVASTQSEVHYPDALNQAMCVRNVTGGQGTNPLWVSKVSNEDFHSALDASMDSARLIGAGGACKYPVDVDLLGLAQPSFGLDMKVTSNVNYKVYDAAGQPVLMETIVADYTATFSDAAIGVVRVKKANEGSVRTNISKFLEKLQALKVP
jgi:hypothetical protein